MPELTPIPLLESLFAGNGEMAHLMRSHDWSQTPLGAVEQWPQSLRTTVSILLNSRYPMFTFWGPKLVKLYNDAYRPVLGLTKHPSALGRPAIEIWPDIWDAIGPLVEQVITRGESTWSNNMLLLMQRSGYIEETYFTFSYSPVRDETGGVGGLFCACTETTQQVLGERRLRTLRDLAAQAGEAKTAEAACQIAAKALANNPADLPFALLYLLDHEGTQTHLAGITGLQPNTIASPTSIDLSIDLSQGGEPESLWGWPLANVLKTNQIERVEDVIARFGSLNVGGWEESPHTALILPVASPGQDRPTGLLVAGISSRRALDDDYQGFLQLVAGQVATAIADARVYEAERQRAEALAELDQAKTIFFSNVSHEFRTPLTLMLAPVEDVLADTEVPLLPIQRDRVEIVQRNGRRLLKLVNTLLDFSRIEAGRMEVTYEPIDLATFTADLASMFRSLIERAGLSLLVECPPLSTSIYVDRAMWEKIVLNLLSNAFKFTLTGAITVRLWDCQDHVELAIEDTGIGIPSDEISHLFERFHRVRGSQGRSFEGSGIGLSLVQELVKLHGGTIQVTSQLGQGSCMTVSIPTGVSHLPKHSFGVSRALVSGAMGAIPYVEEAERWLHEDTSEYWVPDDESPLDSTTPPMSPPAQSSTSTARILVVDDNADMRAYMKRLLEHRYTVATASNGIEALTAVRQALPDLVLTDVMMPRLDGFSLLQALRTNADTRELPIILLSARAGEEARVEGLAAGADDYLTKPFSSRELMARVEATLKLTQIRQEASQREQVLRLTAEQAQQETETTFARLTQLLESMSDAFVELDQDWRITYQNAAAERVNNGKPRSQVLGKTHWEEWPNSVGSELERQYRHAIAEQVPVHFEHHYYAPPTFDRWLEIHAYPSETSLGIFFRDITERKQAEAALQASQLLLQRQLVEIEAIYQSAPIGLNVLDADLRFVRLNQRLAEMNGLTVEAHLGRTVREVLPEMADAAEQLLHPILETGEPLLNVEINGETPSQPGVQRTWLESFLPLRDGDRIIGISTVCEEITDRKQAEQALIQAKDELEMRVVERTEELQQVNVLLQKELVQRERIELELQESASSLRSLYQVIAARHHGFEERIQDLLAMGCRIFGLESGILARVQHGQYQVMVMRSPDQAMKAGTTFDVQHTLCCETLETDEPLLIEHVAASQWRHHPAYTIFQMERYIGTHILVAGKVYSTISFSSKTPGVDQFKPAHKELLKLMAQWIGTEIERLEAETELRQMSAALENAVSGISRLDAQGRYLAVNYAYANPAGYTPEELLGMDWGKTVHPDDLERLMLAYQQMLQDGKVEVEAKGIRKDGSVFYKQLVMIAAYDEQHQFIGHHCFMKDISDRKEAEAALQESNRRWRLLVDNVQLVVVGLDIHGNVEYANPFFLKLTGYQLREVLGQNWFNNFLTPGQKFSTQVDFREDPEHNFHAHYQNPILTKAGEERMIVWSNTILRDTSGQPIGTIGIGEDITERYKVERMKAEFISVVSHELRTPLTSMQAALSLLSEKIVDPTSQEGEATIQIATEGTDRLVRLVSDILDLERLESGKVRLEKHLCNIDDLVETAISQIQELAKPAEITLEASLYAYQVQADSDQLLQVLTNLLSNAIKFSPNRSVIQVSVELKQAQKTPHLLFAVCDQGRGIPADNLENIFDRFHQVDSSDSREKGGTGLGLAICRSIVQQHGGEIWAESTMGKGSTFYFTLPMVEKETQNP